MEKREIGRQVVVVSCTVSTGTHFSSTPTDSEEEINGREAEPVFVGKRNLDFREVYGPYTQI